MSKVEYAYPLDEESSLKDLVVICYTTEGEEEIPLVTYDPTHGFPLLNRHRRH